MAGGEYQVADWGCGTRCARPCEGPSGGTDGVPELAERSSAPLAEACHSRCGLLHSSLSELWQHLWQLIQHHMLHPKTISH